MTRPLTADERWELIHRPFQITYFSRSYPWAGLILGDRFPIGRTAEDLLSDEDLAALTVQVLIDAAAMGDQTPTDSGFRAGQLRGRRSDQ